jgi:hypothetical protein
MYIRFPGNAPTFPIGQGYSGCADYPFPTKTYKNARFRGRFLHFLIKAKLHPRCGIPKIKSKEILPINFHNQYITPPIK